MIFHEGDTFFCQRKNKSYGKKMYHLIMLKLKFNISNIPIIPTQRYTNHTQYHNIYN